MKKRMTLISIVTILIMSLVLSACNSSDSTTETQQLGADAGENATELSFWTFVDLHGKHLDKMLGLWNQQNPDKQIKLNVTVMPYDDMHNKLLLAVTSGKGAPDIADIELGQFPKFLEGDNVLLESLNDVFTPYKEVVVPSRVEIYSKADQVYAFDYHVGATLAFYNTEILEQAGVDYTTIKTWEDFKQAGIKVYEQTGKYLGTADTSAIWQASILLAQQNTDFTDENGNPQVNSPEMVRAFEMLVDLQKNNVIATIPGGQPDTEEAKGEYNNGNYASALMPEWYMSRFVNEMKDLKGKYAIAPLPVLEEGNPRSVGLGGTGTVVTKNGKDVQLAKEFVAFAKLSKEATTEIWNTLGFDPINMEVWKDEAVTKNPDNEYVQYFKTNAFDTLNEIKDEIQAIKSVTASPTIGSVFNTVTLNAIFEDGQDVKEALDEAQEAIEQELK